MSPDPALAFLARRIWRRLEPFHSLTYFAQESRAALDAVGMKGFWMGYFAGRAAPMGQVGAAVVTATFYNFHRSRVMRAVPDCWRITSPGAIVRARFDGMVDALTAVVDVDVEALATLSPLARAMAEAACGDIGGRPLFAAHTAIQWPTEGAAIQAWWAATLIREHRGDGHVAALVDAGVGPCEALVLQSTYANIPRATLQQSRNWSDDDWDAAVAALAERGWLDTAGGPNERGRAGLAAIEQRTDELASKPVEIIGVDAAGALAEAALPVAQGVMKSGVVPAITPMFADELP
ncbi:MAG TPA: hypothetical protein VMZ22_13490 [Acidimicrobiales bacterium]|nr:hypothetical protein [Acidimicrobiales bacterium]